MPNEFDFIHWLKQQSPRDERIVVPLGDDLAAMKWAGDDLLLVGVDQVLDGVHFDSTIHSPKQIGRKAMNRNLSDCAAMACLPAAAVCTVALPKGVGEEYAKELYAGMREAADVFNCPILGGDTGSWPGKLVVTVTILGRSAGVTPITRNGAKAGDTIYVTGPLGGSIFGRHMTFHPRIELARSLAHTGLVTSMIDLSDGLSRDIQHLCKQSGVGAEILADLVPIDEAATRAFREDRISPLDHALNDGEDYELLFTSTGSGGPVIQIGKVTADPAIVLVGSDGSRKPLEPKGWEHAM
jgi:thiamine-monophosphate kinase